MGHGWQIHVQLRQIPGSMVDDVPEKNRTGVREAMNGQQTLTWHEALSYDLWFFVELGHPTLEAHYNHDQAKM